MNSMTQQQPIVHSTFVVERTYPSTPARVFAAFANPASKRRWFVEGEGWDIDEFTMDFRVGGRETSRFRFKGGPPVSNETIYLDIVPDQRIVIAYTMFVNDSPISASLATIEIESAKAGDKAGARLIYTEQGAFFEGGAEAVRGREIGCGELMDQLAEELRTHG